MFRFNRTRCDPSADAGEMASSASSNQSEDDEVTSFKEVFNLNSNGNKTAEKVPKLSKRTRLRNWLAEPFANQVNKHREKKRQQQLHEFNMAESLRGMKGFHADLPPVVRFKPIETIPSSSSYRSTGSGSNGPCPSSNSMTTTDVGNEGDTVEHEKGADIEGDFVDESDNMGLEIGRTASSERKDDIDVKHDSDNNRQDSECIVERASEAVDGSPLEGEGCKAQQIDAEALKSDRTSKEDLEGNEPWPLI